MKKNLLITAILAVATSAAAIGTPAGQTIQNIGQFEYSDFDNTSKTIETTPVNITVASVYNANVGPNGTTAAPGQTVTAAPGQTATLTYTLTNDGNTTDSFNLAVQDGNGNTLPGATIYLDNGDGVFGPGDTVVTSVANLPADQQVKLFVTYTVPANTPGNQSTYVNLVATSAGNGAVVDNNNVGEITAVNVVSFTLATDNSVNVQPNVATQITHTLTNTGNTALIAADLRASSTIGGTNPTANGTISYTVVNSSTGASVSNTDLQAALQAAGNLAAGGTYTITVTYTPAAGATDGQSFTNTISVYSATASSTTVRNDVPSTTPVSDTDTLTVQRGIAAVTKTADNCGTVATCTGTITTNTTSAKPGDYLRYTVRVTNTGTGVLKFPTLRDYVPANTEFYSVTGSTTQMNASVLFSGNRASWNTSAPTTLATATFTGTVNNGPFVYVGLNTDGNATVDANDALAAGQSLTLVITVKVK